MAVAYSFEETVRSVASLHLDIGSGVQSSSADAGEEVRVRSRESGALPSMSAEMPPGASAGADAAAGGSRRAAGHESNTRAGRKSCPVDLQLPIEALGGSRVASAGAVQLEQNLQDAATLHSRAMSAIDRIARQNAAVRRFPMACPACGTLNAPQGLSWGAGDIVACQGCNHSFVPLGHGLQDGDLSLLRTAVQQMRVQSERAQYLEQVIIRNKAASPGTPSALSPPSAPHHGRRGQAAGRSESVPGRAADSPSGLLRRSPTRRSLATASDDQEGAHMKSKARAAVPQNMMAAAGEDSKSEHQKGKAASPKHAAVPAPAESEPKLVSLMDTQDLLTESSDASSKAPCFYGRKLRHRQPSLDTWQNMQQNISNIFTAKTPRPREREEGECTSASVSDGEISSASSFTGRAGRYKHGRTAGLTGQCHMQAEPPSAAFKEGATTDLNQDAGSSAAALQPSAAQLHAAAKQLVLLVLTLSVHGALRIVFNALGLGRAMATTILTATLSSSTFAVVKFAQRGLDKHWMMDTSNEPNMCAGTSSLRLYGVLVEFTTEEALGLACTLAQLAIAFFFENWGLHGPASCRWLAIAGHVVAAVLLIVGVSWWLERYAKTASSGEGTVLWLCLTFGNWATASWAAATWWHSAATVMTATNSEWDSMDMSAVSHGCMPIVASVVIHSVNMWTLSQGKQPLLLFACVLLSGLSMACSCFAYCSPLLSALELAPWRSAVLPIFCMMSAWVLWHELLNPL